MYEDFLRNLFLVQLFYLVLKKQEIQENNTEPVTILTYYQDEDSEFAEKMFKYSFVERTAPKQFKKYWAHHYYLLFTPENSE